MGDVVPLRGRLKKPREHPLIAAARAAVAQGAVSGMILFETDARIVNSIMWPESLSLRRGLLENAIDCYEPQLSVFEE